MFKSCFTSESGNALTRIVDYSQLYPKEPTAKSILLAKEAGMVAYLVHQPQESSWLVAGIYYTTRMEIRVTGLSGH